MKGIRFAYVIAFQNDDTCPFICCFYKIFFIKRALLKLFYLPYSKKLTCDDFNTKVINAEEINAVEELLLYFFNEINVVSTRVFQIT